MILRGETRGAPPVLERLGVNTCFRLGRREPAAGWS